MGSTGVIAKRIQTVLDQDIVELGHRLQEQDMPIFERQSESGDLLIGFEPTDLVMAGWTGRDEAALRAHIDELAEHGVEPPSKTPLFYRIDPALLAGPVDEIKVIGDQTSGEAEVVILSMPDGLWVGLGSDHTDRGFEAHSVQLSKQLCRKPMAETLWSYDEVIDHWDEMILRSHIIDTGERVLYQEGRLAALRHPEDLIAAYRAELEAEVPDDDSPLPVGTVLFCGTMPAIGGIRPATHFEMELEDPIKERSLRHEVAIDRLPEVR